ncbi:patatin-like phospholipase family protein [Gemmobacter nectariphilus]|uniref:patatin-like phospholipase family protein n=1 Tax=Gemmobacter nectariphilus TaxID=220343 RepID=UPI000409B02D|nr:patatin-like phospholipase family protein [Gemmobacter nectariphilus]
MARSGNKASPTPPRPRIGLALGSGGARGWCHIGVLRELEAMGLRPDVVAGCSMGALVGAVWAVGQLDALEDIAQSMTWTRVLRMLDVRFSGGGLIGGAGILGLLDRVGLSGRIEDMPLPFIAIATDISTGREVWLSKGKLDDAVRASIAMPGVIAPKEIDGRWLIDGGVTNPVPVSAARALGADVVLAVNPASRSGGNFWTPGPARGPRLSGLLPAALPARFRTSAEDRPVPPAYVHLVTTTIDIMTDQLRRSRLAGDAPDLLMNAKLSDMSVLDFHKAEQAIAEGRRIARAHAALLADWVRDTPPPAEDGVPGEP